MLFPRVRRPSPTCTVVSLPFSRVPAVEPKPNRTVLGAGLSAAFGQITITAAYTYAPAKEISVYDYTQLIFTTLIGFIIFGDVPDVYSFIGYAIIVGAAVASFLHVRKSA